MKKKTSPAKAKPTPNNQGKDAVMLGSLYILTFVALQVVNFLALSIKYGTINIDSLQTRCVAQFFAFLCAYFITLIYIKNNSK
jgi:hypothetical protein